jgi:hypothetical protein
MNARASLHVPGVASWIEFRAAREQRVRAVRFPRLTLVRVREGAKEICHGGQRMLAHAATLLLAPAGSVMDVCNQPGAGRFRSECLTLDPTLVERFAVREASLLHGAPPLPCVAVTPMLAEVWAHGKALHQGWVQRQAFRTKTPRPWLIAYIHHATGRGQQQGGGMRQHALAAVADFFGAFAHPHQGQPGKAHRTHALLAGGAKLDPAGHARHMQAGARVHRL